MNRFQSCPNHFRATGLYLLAGFLGCAGFSGAATIGTSSWLQVNLSYMPFSYYDTTHAAASYGFSSPGFPSSCPSGASVRSCFQTVLANMRAQKVSGVRIFVTLCDPASFVFSNCGSSYTAISWNPGANTYQGTWIANVTSFFEDVAAAGIQNVTITMADAPATISQPVSSATSPNGRCDQGFCCDIPPGTTTINFSPTQPFGVQPVGGNPVGNYWNTGTNQAYNCSPVNPYFLGWNNEFDVINAMLAAASGKVIVYELEGEQEMNLAGFTVLARYIYDNSAPQSAGLAAGQIVNVVSRLRSLMTAHGFDPGRVNWSSVGTEGTTASANCTNIYTDWSRNFGPDEIATAINGGGNRG